MTSRRHQELAEQVLYILCKTGGIDHYHIFKILYFAQLKHIAKWGVGIVPDTFCALQYGPVPTELYNAIKQLNNPTSELAILLSSIACSADMDAPNVLLPKRDYNQDFLSASAIEALDSSINENAHLTFNQLKQKSHDTAWQEAIDNNIGTSLSLISMAKLSNPDPSFLAYIQEMAAINDYFA